MVALSTFPDMDVLEEMAKKIPGYMHPNTIPLAVIAEGLLSGEECREVSEELDKISTYEFPKCGALTRECGHVPVLDHIRDFTRQMNAAFWNYDIDEVPMTWLQTYRDGGEYDLHADCVPGQVRKLTAVTLLTDPREYEDGELVLHFHPASFQVPRTQGTTVVFQSSVFHQVYPVAFGFRQTTNMGFFGPPFR